MKKILKQHQLNEMKYKISKTKPSQIPLVIGALSTVTKGLVDGREDLEITGRMEII